MSNYKLITVLSSFSPVEWREFYKFIQNKSPNNSDIYKLSEHIIKKFKNRLDKWDTAQVHERLFPDISRKAFLNMMSKIVGWAEEFLITRSVLNNDIQYQFSLLRQYTQRGLYALSDTVAVKLEKLIEQLDPTDFNTYALRRELYHIIYFSNNPIKEKSGQEILCLLTKNHIDASSHLDYFYRAELHNWGALKKQDFNQEVSVLRRRCDLYSFTEDHFLPKLIKMVENNDFTSFIELKNMLFAMKWSDHSETHILVTHYLIAWVIKFWQNGQMSDPDLILQLYEYGLDSKILLTNGRIPERRFHNIISTIGGLNQSDWGLVFINEWVQKIDSARPQDNRALGLAQHAFYNQEYEKIIPLLRSIKFKNTGQQVRLMGLQLIAWFEDRKEYPGIFYDYCANFKRYLKRNEDMISAQYHDSHLNLINFLYDYAKSGDENQLYNELNSGHIVIYRTYLLEKVNNVEEVKMKRAKAHFI